MPPLPLIRCPECNAGNVLWFVSGTVENLGRHFYKCEWHEFGGCRFWKWENNYIVLQHLLGSSTLARIRVSA
uniref:GRF-type domain-containing protein n=1 Tax=Triticum urartu TaxID=4572 RepID=A0A8R7QGT3_TRIUA